MEVTVQRRLRRGAGAAAVALLAASACSSGGGAGYGHGPQAAVPVVVARAVQKDVPLALREIGNVEPYSTVSVKSQIDGQVARVHFQEGERVRRDDLLFTIDPRTFEAKLHQAEADLARDQASAENARVDERRLKNLLAQGLVSQSEYDQAHAQAAALGATVAADRAAVETARLQLQYCYIRSPIDGRIGQILVHAGNVVKNNDTTLAVANQIRPIYVSFSVPEQQLPEIRRRAAGGQLPVQVFLGKNSGDPVTGTLSFINNTVDASTGTILLKGLFPNQDEALWPGQFVDVALILATTRNAVVVPVQAVEAGQDGSYVYVVKPDLTVALQPVVTGGTVGTETIIATGVRAGERVVTDGQVRLAPGFKVQIKNAAAGAPSAAAAPGGS